MISNLLYTCLTVIALLSITQANAQTVTRLQPSHAEMVARYKRAAKMDSLTKNAVFKSDVAARWSADGKTFWYCNVLKDSVLEYISVEATSGRKQKIDRPATSVTAAGGGRRSPQSGRIRGSRSGGTSPDKKWEAYIERGNIYVKPVNGGTPIQFTTNGTISQPYGMITWSPDSKYLAGYHIHPIQDSTVSYILTSLPGTTRGDVMTRPYKQPGDPFTSYTLYLFPLDQNTPIKVQAEDIDFPGSAPALRWRYDNPRYFTYEKFDRGHQRLRVIEVDGQTGQTRNVVDEKTNTFIYLDKQIMHYPAGTNQLIRSSEKNGWRHLYLVDLVTGSEQPISKGEWVVRSLDSVDMVKKQIWFTASGMYKEQDPYLVYYYRIGFDGKNLKNLTPDVGNHQLSFSPDRTYFLDNYSQVNVAPITKLRRTADGKEITLLEEADLSYYKQAGVSPPEVFVAKGRDGVTDIWGIISRPSDYDPGKKYPVLENIYAGPHDSFVPKSFVPYSEMQSLAELGFIVVMIDGMGTYNRSKAFQDVCWQNIADAGFPDRILWIKALAAKYPYVDAERVGIYGTSAGGQNSTGALLYHPEFYQAAVSACGCHDNRVDKQWWNEQWMGYPVGMHYEAQSNVTNAAKLQGHLLLIVGEADTNVPPESTYRVADELIKAGKDFDFLSIPGMGHSDGGPFGRMKKRNFFVKHLMGVDPPNWNAGELALGQELGRERWSFQ